MKSLVINKTLQKDICVVVILIVSTLLAWKLYFRYYDQQDTVDIHSFPSQIEEWKSEELPISEEEYAILETRNVFARRYSNNEGREIFLTITYSQTNRKVSHPPELCYTGGGISVIQNKLGILDLRTPQGIVPIHAHQLLLQRGNTQQVAFYWYKVGGVFTASYWDQQLIIAQKTLLGKMPSSALIRIATTISKNDQSDAIVVIHDFAENVLPYLQQYLP